MVAAALNLLHREAEEATASYKSQEEDLSHVHYLTKFT